MKSRPQGERKEKERDTRGGGRGDGQQGMKITWAKQREGEMSARLGERGYGGRLECSEAEMQGFAG